MTLLKAVNVRALCLLKRGFPKRTISGTSLFISPTVPCSHVLYPGINDGMKLTNLGRLHTGSVRWKYYKKTTSSVDEEDSDSDEETANFKDDRDSKVIKSSVNSLRLDLILKSGLGLARNKVEVIFYENKIRVNGEKITKKSVLIDVGDEIDVVKGFSPANPSHILIGRVQVLSLSEKEGCYKVIMRRFKSLVVENYSGQNMWKSASAS